MLSVSWRQLRRVSPAVAGLLGLLTALLFAGSQFVVVRIVVVRPPVGEIGSAVETLWNVSVGTASLASFGLALYNHLTDTADEPGGRSGVVVTGENHDVTINMGPREADAADTDESTTEAETDTETDESTTDTGTDTETDESDDRPTTEQ